MVRSPPLLEPGVSLLSWCQVLQQCLQQGSSNSTLPGCRGLPTGLHLLTVLLPAIFRVCNGSNMESTGADLRSIYFPAQCCRRLCSLQPDWRSL